jgi:membrane associated rhomboid family serine protease
VLLFLIVLMIIGGVVFKLLTGDERQHALQTALAIVEEIKHAARTRPEEAAVHDALKERVRWVLVVPALIALMVMVFVAMTFGAGSLADADTLIGWGASIGTRTSNAEWWRLVTAIFVHSGLTQVIVFSIGLAQVGSIVERGLGRPVMAVAFLFGGIFSGLTHLSNHPAALGFGASGAVFGVYGLFAAFMAWTVITKSPLRLPRPALKKLTPAAALFVLYALANGNLDASADLTGFMCGAFCGIVVLVGTTDPLATPKRAAAALAAVAIFAIGSAIPLRGFANIAPELARLVTVEKRTSAVYEAADKKFHQRKITADALADLIDREIVPELNTSQARLDAIHKVPQEHQHMMDDARRFVVLRAESWRFRSQALRRVELRDLQKTNGIEESTQWRRRADAQHRANLAMLGNADGKEYASLQVLKRIEGARFY